MDSTSKYKIGDAVRVAADNPTGNPRTPKYIRGKRGVIGGRISTFASAATLYEVGFNHFWRAPSPARHTVTTRAPSRSPCRSDSSRRRVYTPLRPS